MRQPTFFDNEKATGDADVERLVLYALGEFQARGKALAERDLPLDRLRGALRRAADALGVEQLADEAAVAAFGRLGAQVRRVPAFVAKHPFRITVPSKLAERALALYKEQDATER
ncbi:MAG TPA: hypothetical protein VNA19_09210 [Pyrinomonadaceae bacterium]|jgi:hypothetical protein|nr:hypothetical protein [Pyrinomonadaceae bacterium]